MCHNHVMRTHLYLLNNDLFKSCFIISKCFKSTIESRKLKMNERGLIIPLSIEDGIVCDQSGTGDARKPYANFNGISNGSTICGKSAWRQQVEVAYRSLKNDKIIAVPTDTIYGIAGLAQSTDAIEKLYSIKNRDALKPIAICVGNIDEISKWGKLTITRQLLTELLPGPVTIVLERTAKLNPALNPGTSLVGIRVPDYGFIQTLTKACGEPLALTSANMSTKPSAVTIQEFADLWPELDIVFDGGTVGTCAKSRLGSTVVDLSISGQYSVIRPGSAYEQTVQTLEKFGLTAQSKT